jgi:soluble lytic murein transglycosylase-like protein
MRRRFPWWALALLALAVVALPGGAAVAVAVKLANDERSRVRRALREAGVKQNVDPDILEAIGYVESGWKLGARSTDPRDEARGGSWGPTQLSERTARAYGYRGEMAALQRDPDLAAEWTARIMRARPGGPPETVEDASAWWNAGRASAAQLGPSHETRTSYIPRALAALALVQKESAA